MWENGWQVLIRLSNGAIFFTAITHDPVEADISV